MSSTASTINLQINPSLDNGGVPITAYKLYMDAGSLTSSYSLLSGYDGTSSTYSVTSGVDGIVSGVKYRFILTSTNSIGESDPSNEVRFAAANSPS